VKLRYRGTGRLLIQGVAREFQDGDIIDLPKAEAEKLLKANRFFEKVEESEPSSKIVKIKKEEKD